MQFVTLVIIILFILITILLYNKLIKSRNLKDEAWSIINVYLKKRYDLLPNLVETIKGYTTHESQTLENVVLARNQALAAQTTNSKQKAEQDLQKSMLNLFAVVENYPELKANSNFQQLQTELSSLESDIEKARRYYNGTVREYNNKVETMPSNIIARLFGFKKTNFFELENSIQEKQVPQIRF